MSYVPAIQTPFSIELCNICLSEKAAIWKCRSSCIVSVSVSDCLSGLLCLLSSACL